jgi:TRAP-type C4-dicarboxylate transport system substrate-binding protein
MKLQNSRQGRRGLPAVAGLATVILALAGCAGSAGASGSGQEAGEGYEYGASEEEIKAAFADVEPTTLVYQPAAFSENDLTAHRAQVFAETIERLSAGKITIDLVYAQAIAAQDELPDALSDGRVDLANVSPVAHPNLLPKYSSLIAATSGLPSSPLVGELAGTAALSELWWESPEVIEELTSNDLNPILPIEPITAPMSVCTDEKTEASDWDGALVRGSSTAHASQIQGMGASPTDIAFAEMYEGLQRKTIDCVIIPALAIPMTGVGEVAPHIGYTTTTSFARGPGMIVGGSKFAALPLAAQQLIFDQGLEKYMNSRYSDFESTALAAQSIREANGDFNELSDEVQEKLAASNEELVQEQIDNGSIAPDTTETLNESYEKWKAVAEDMGYQDQGGLADFDQWYSQDDYDLRPFATKLFEEEFLDHRPDTE